MPSVVDVALHLSASTLTWLADHPRVGSLRAWRMGSPRGNAGHGNTKVPESGHGPR